MATQLEVLEAVEEVGQRPAAVLDRLKKLYGLTDADIAEPFGMRDSEIQMRRAGTRGIKPGEIAGLARFFDLPEQVFFLTPAEAVAEALRRDPDLRGPISSCITPEPAAGRPRALVGALVAA